MPEELRKVRHDMVFMYGVEGHNLQRRQTRYTAGIREEHWRYNMAFCELNQGQAL
jgi:hypothetical protein